ncbi:unnamed protein product [Closterium sp. Yama58-4]|nr:unnamed protein product [Closterium sp. Yama58-4]
MCVLVTGMRHHPYPRPQAATGTASSSGVAGVDLSRVVLLSPWAPRAFLYKRFLSDAECDHIIARATPRLERSGVVNNDDGSSFVSDIRTSSGAFLTKGEDAVMKAVEQRISEWTFLPLQNQEALQVLRYTKGQKYEPHVDYFHDPVNTQRGGHRYATVLMYLNNVTLGGETVFPKVKDDSPKDETWSDCAKGFLAAGETVFPKVKDDSPKDETWSDCAKGFLAVLMYVNNVILKIETVLPKVKNGLPKDETWSDCAKGFPTEKGDALLFVNLHPNGTSNPFPSSPPALPSSLFLPPPHPISPLSPFPPLFPTPPVKPEKGDALLFFNLHPDGTPDPASLHYACPVPEKGDALLFFNLHPDGSPDPASLHYACPVVHGVKWSAPKWIHVADFDKPLTAADAGADGAAADGAAAGGGDGACTDSNA